METTVALQELSSLLRNRFATLNEGLLLNDENINYVVQALIQPGVPNMRCYPCYFFQKLLHKTETNPRHDHVEVGG